jgi:hypothetical protein
MVTYSICLPVSRLFDSSCSKKYVIVLTGQSSTQRDGSCRILFNDFLSSLDCKNVYALSDPAPKFIVTPHHKELVVLKTELTVSAHDELGPGLGLWSCDGRELIQDSGSLYKVEARITSWALGSKSVFLSRYVSIIPNVKFSWVLIAEGGILNPIPG